MKHEGSHYAEKKMKKLIVVSLMLVFVMSSHMESVESSAADCYDACSTACVQPNTRLMQRCDRKCQIKCDPAGAVSELQGHLV